VWTDWQALFSSLLLLYSAGSVIAMLLLQRLPLMNERQSSIPVAY